MARQITTVTIRAMEPEDIDDILEVDRKIMGEQRAITYKGLVRGALGGEIAMSFVAEADGKFIGFVLAYLTYVREQVTEACIIQILGVDPDYHHQGVATKLIETLLDKCREKGIKLVRTMVEENDHQLQSFFKKAGFGRGQYVSYARSV